MKKRLLPCLICLALLLAGCGGPGPGGASAADTPPESVQEPTAELNVYLADRFYEGYLDTLVRTFRQSHPDVALNVVSVYWGNEEEGQKLPAELAAGRGPDLYVGFANEFKDLYKVLNTGVFCDLAPYLERMEHFDRSQYLETVLEGGVYQGRQLFMPLTWNYPALVTTREALGDAGITAEELGTFSGLMRAAQKYSAANGGASAFLSRFFATSFFSCAGGLQLDYGALRADVDTAEFKEMIDAYKLIYPQDWAEEPEEGLPSGMPAFLLRGRRHLFTNHATALGATFPSPTGIGELFSDLAGNETPLLLPIPSVEGKTLASVLRFAAINANSKNKANAADFLELLLQKNFQDKLFGNPVYRPLLEERAKGLLHLPNADTYNKIDNSGTVLATPANLTKEESEQLLGALLRLDGVQPVYLAALWEIVFDDMEPYFKDEQSYDACLRRLQSDLAIYISE